MIMCDTRASGITADLNDSYFVRIEPRPNGGALVLWTDLQDEARVFDDAGSAAEFCRDSPLEMFVVSFVPVAGPLPSGSTAQAATPSSAGRSRGCQASTLRFATGTARPSPVNLADVGSQAATSAYGRAPSRKP